MSVPTRVSRSTPAAAVVAGSVFEAGVCLALLEREDRRGKGGQERRECDQARVTPEQAKVISDCPGRRCFSHVWIWRPCWRVVTATRVARAPADNESLFPDR
jgi:hypothetical protein